VKIQFSKEALKHCSKMVEHSARMVIKSRKLDVFKACIDLLLRFNPMKSKKFTKNGCAKRKNGYEEYK
jgi:hypothetical protein